MDTHEESSSAGWVSATDLFLLTSVLFLGAAIYWAAIASEIPPQMRGNLVHQIDRLQATITEKEAELTLQRRLFADQKRELDVATRTATTQSDKIEEMQKQLGQLEALRSQLLSAQQQIVELRSSVTGDQSRLAELQHRLDDANKELSELQKARQQLKEAEAAKQQGERLAQELEQTKASLKKLALELTFARATIGEQQKREGDFRQELLGFEGKLDRVVFVIDRSSSMNNEGRWASVQRIVGQWIRLLPIKEAALVVFDDEVTSLPENGLQQIRSDDDRKAFLTMLARLQPRGNTNTHAALKKALAYGEVDAVFLFSDGEPNRGPTFQGDYDLAIYQMIENAKTQGCTTRINAIAMGDYFNTRCGAFLKAVASKTNGVFIGK